MDKLIEWAKSLWNGLVESQKNSQQPTSQPQQPEQQQVQSQQPQAQPQQPAQPQPTQQQPVQQPQNPTTQQPQQPTSQPQQQIQQTTPPKMDNQEIVFWQPATQIWYSQEKRNEYIASNLAGQYKQALQKGELNDTTRDQMLVNTIKQYGGSVDWSNPDWTNTIDSIYKKVLPQLGTGKWDDLYKTQSKYDFNQPLDSQLTDYKNGKISSQDLDKLKSTNPDGYNQLMNKVNDEQNKEINSLNMQTYNSLATDQKLPSSQEILQNQAGNQGMDTQLKSFLQAQDTLSKDGQKYLEEYQKAITAPEVLEQTQQLNKTTAQIDEVNVSIETVAEEYKQRLTGKVDSATLNAIIADKTYKLVQQRNGLVREATRLTNSINSVKQNAKDKLDAWLQMNQLQRQSLQDQLQTFTLGYNIFKDQQDRDDRFRMVEYQFNLDMQSKAMDIANKKEFAKWEKSFVEGNIEGDSQERRTYITNQVKDVLKQYEWLPVYRSVDQISSDIEKVMQVKVWQGMSVAEAFWQALTENLIQPIQSKPEFRYWVANKNGIDLNVKPTSLGDGFISMPDGKWGWSIISKSQMQPIQTDGAYQQKALSRLWALQNGQDYGQCGKFVNDYLQSLGGERVFGDSFDGKKQLINSNSPSVGAVAIMASKTSPSYGHVWIVTKVDGENIYITDANYKSDGKVLKDHIVKASSITGYYVPSSARSQTPQATGNLSPSQQAAADKYLSTGAYDEKAWEKMGLTVEMVNAYKQKNDKFETDNDFKNLSQLARKYAGWATLSKDEWAALDATLKQNLKSWMDKDAAVYSAIWFNVKEITPFAKNLLDKMGAMEEWDRKGTFLASLAEKINSGNYAGAVSDVESRVYKGIKQDLGKDYLSEAVARATSQASLEYIADYNTLVKMHGSPVWPIRGWIESLKGKFKDDATQKIATKLLNINAKIRSELSGVAVTEAESKYIDDLLPSITDKPTQAINKLQNFSQEALRKVNSQRSGKLPLLTTEQLLFPEKKVSLYGDISKPKQTGIKFNGFSIGWLNQAKPSSTGFSFQSLFGR